MKDDEISAAEDEGDDDEEALVPNVHKLHGESHIPWNELADGPRASVLSGRFEADSYPVMFELPAGTR
jgi:hypothetical protein